MSATTTVTRSSASRAGPCGTVPSRIQPTSASSTSTTAHFSTRESASTSCMVKPSPRPPTITARGCSTTARAAVASAFSVLNSSVSITKTPLARSSSEVGPSVGRRSRSTSSPRSDSARAISTYSTPPILPGPRLGVGPGGNPDAEEQSPVLCSTACASFSGAAGAVPPWCCTSCAASAGWASTSAWRVLVVAGVTSDSGPTVAAVYTVARLVIPIVVPVLATGMLVTGVLLGLGTKYGLVQWTWVLTKLVIGTVLFALVYVALVPGALGIPADLPVGSARGGPRRGRHAGTNLIYPPVVSFLALALRPGAVDLEAMGPHPMGAPDRGDPHGEAVSRTAR